MGVALKLPNATEVEVLNNIFLDTGALDSESGSGLYDYNLKWNYNGGQPSHQVAANVGKLTEGSNNIVADPGLNQFGDPVTSYYRAISADSSVVDAGVATGFSFLGASPDIGAFEFNPEIPWDDEIDWGNTPINRRGLLDDANGNGIANLTEVALSEDPTSGQINNPIIMNITDNGDGTKSASLFYQKRSDQFNIIMQVSRDLDSWDSANVSGELSNGRPNSYLQTVTVSSEDNEKLFMRLQVTLVE